MSPDLDIRPYQPGDEYSILKLFEQSYGRELDYEFWKWRFQDNPLGPGIIYLCWDGNVLVSHYAVTPVSFWIDGNTWLTGLSGTTMTHPDYRGYGLFQKLAQATYEDMLCKKMGMVWGFPNAMIHRTRVQQLKWVDIYEVPMFRLRLDRISLPTSVSPIVELIEFDVRFDRLWERVKHNYRIVAKRDCAHLQWRYGKNPREHYRFLAFVEGAELLGYAVFKRYKDEIQVVDILAVDTEVGSQLILRAIHIATEEAASTLSLWLNVNHPLHHTLEKLGFINGEPVTYLGGRILHPDLLQMQVFDFRNWYLTMGDSDVF